MASDQVGPLPIEGPGPSPQENGISGSSSGPWTAVDAHSGYHPPPSRRPQDDWFKGSSTTSCSETFRICAQLLQQRSICVPRVVHTAVSFPSIGIGLSSLCLVCSQSSSLAFALLTCPSLTPNTCRRWPWSTLYPGPIGTTTAQTPCPPDPLCPLFLSEPALSCGPLSRSPWHALPDLDTESPLPLPPRSCAGREYNATAEGNTRCPSSSATHQCLH